MKIRSLASALWFDTWNACRFLGKNRGSTLLAVLSIALGIGVTATLFSVADALIFRPFPFPRAEELCRVTSIADDRGAIGYGWQDVEDLRRAATGLGEVIAVNRAGMLLAGELTSELVLTHYVTANFFTVLGGRSELGQPDLTPAGDGRPRLVLGHRLWQHRFGGDRSIVGRTIMLNQRPFVVAGVMPADFTGVMRNVPADVWVGMDAYFASFSVERRAAEQVSRRGQFEVLLRLQPGITTNVAAARLDAAIRGAGIRPSAPAGTAGTTLRRAFTLNWREKLLIGGGVLPVFGLLLLVACANAAQLRLAQAEARRKELGVRLALGSSPWQLARLLLIETLLVSVAGAGLGLWLATEAMVFISARVAAVTPVFDLGIGLDWRVGAFVIGATGAATLLAGLAPMRHALRLDVLEILKDEAGTPRAKNRLQRTLLAGQTAASVVFFGLALLFIDSFRHAATVWPGFDPDRPMAVLSVAPARRMPRTTWCEQACAQLRALPGIRDATYARRLPLSGSGGGYRVRVEASERPPIPAAVNMVAGNYFTVMRPRLAAGRGLAATDRADSARVAVVSQGLAQQLTAGRSALGLQVTIEGELREIVGVVEDAPSNALHETPEPLVYLPFAQFPRGDLTFIVETSLPPAALLHTIQQELKRFDPDAMIFGAGTLQQHMDRALFADRTAAQATTGLGLLGFALTAAGLFGMIQYTVNQRTRELGVRIALGASPRVIQRAVLGESLRLVAPGIVLGLGLLAGGAWALRSWLFGVQPLNPVAYGACVVAAIAVALLAAWLPARRATRIDPLAALRAE